MKHIFLINFVIFFFLIHCESIQRYSLNRAYDTADVFTIGIEKGNIGTDVFFWCLGGGLTINSNSRGIGMRDGHFGIYEISNSATLDIIPIIRKESPANKVGISNIFVNSSGHSQYRPKERTKNKDYQILNILTIVPVPSIPSSNKKIAKCNAPLKLEASIGLYYGIRLGFNLNELFDLMIGFSSLDILEDEEPVD
ncbi:hypothetical protein [Leptospira brenneri]|uniref:Uncharacterized protein n=1 Tax=Leptospira brenneri TaxID=2023182 RepID=A0A2M9Y0N7_9LEPT|nr:hypothetical protein [Leptospira brenneri]PJZ45151.1 hypothetical protein CH361_13055 [Leptospira brenneri]TGK95079.1 hypothetical protein EHQ30_00035 [Leptospira brenneri]